MDVLIGQVVRNLSWQLIIGLLLAAVHSAASAAQQSVLIDDLQVVVWSPLNASTAPQPVVIFSHGFHGCATQSQFLMEAMAAAGYWVFALNHADATCAGGHAHWVQPAQLPFRSPERWSDATYQSRAKDIQRLLKALPNDEHFRGRLDLNRVALAGHSLGGYTALGVAGAWPGWTTPGIRAVLALAPYAQPFLEHHTLQSLKVPVMFQGGTLDAGITPAIIKAGGIYDASPTPKYLVEFSGATHFAWTDVGWHSHEAIVHYSLAFLDRYLQSEHAGLDTSLLQQAGDALTQKTEGVAMLRYDNGPSLGTSANTHQVADEHATDEHASERPTPSALPASNSGSGHGGNQPVPLKLDPRLQTL